MMLAKLLRKKKVLQFELYGHLNHMAQTFDQFATVQGVPSARELGWVDWNFVCSTVCPILPGNLVEVAG